MKPIRSACWLAFSVGLGSLAGFNVSLAESSCDAAPPSAELGHDCIEFADRRFRIPVGHFSPWLYVDTTDPSKRIRLRFPKGRTGEGYFLFVAGLPGLSPSPVLTEIRKIPDADFETFKRISGTKPTPGVLAVVQRRENSRIGLRMQRQSERWAFADSLVSNLLAQGCTQLDRPPTDPLVIRCARGDTYHLYRSGGYISHVLIDAPGLEGYVCQIPFSEGIYLSVDVTEEHRAEICSLGQQLRDKLRSFEY